MAPCFPVMWLFRDDSGKTVVMVMDPVAALGVIGNAELTEIAAMVRAKMELVLSMI